MTITVWPAREYSSLNSSGKHVPPRNFGVEHGYLAYDSSRVVLIAVVAAVALAKDFVGSDVHNRVHYQLKLAMQNLVNIDRLRPYGRRYLRVERLKVVAALSPNRFASISDSR